MPYLETVTDLGPETLSRFDAIIDVRSPAEYADDHMPGAINLPVLSNAERAIVGTIYRQESPFRASRVGGAIVARNIAGHLETALADMPRGWRPLVYCWRGGMRSNAMATILSSVGWPVGLVKGGYRTWRRDVVAGLDGDTSPLPIILIDGPTGSGKTAILQALEDQGGQVIDLEGLANHRGSAFGGFDDLPQPAQRLFETHIWDQLRQFDLSCPIFVEAESARVGVRRVPRRLWHEMLAAKRVEIRAPASVRSEFLVTAYGDAVNDPGSVARALALLKPFHAKETLAGWQALADAGEHRKLAEALMLAHYDPLYARSRKRRDDTPVQIIDLPALSADDIEAAAKAILTQA
ncbi:tRNA 2-selenouridine(34) synthase MnmH [Hyphomonas sp.]|uniref:tRNA 2-selenouridine(34) synthase MnmH n=1 Tax=Hyphomonas sp. TaxID=87 RepID=UPI0032F02367